MRGLAIPGQPPGSVPADGPGDAAASSAALVSPGGLPAAPPRPPRDGPAKRDQTAETPPRRPAGPPAPGTAPAIQGGPSGGGPLRGPAGAAGEVCPDRCGGGPSGGGPLRGPADATAKVSPDPCGCGPSGGGPLRGAAGAAGEVFPDPCGGGPSGGGVAGGEGWGWDGDDWDLAGALTAREVAALAALDRADGLAGDWDEDPGGVPPADAGGWAAGPGAGSGAVGWGAAGRGLAGWRASGGEPSSRPGCAPVEVLPGLMPRRLGAGGGFDAGGGADRVPPGPVLAGLAGDRWAGGLGRASDDELAGLMIAWRRLASWAAAGEFAAVAELARRREAQGAAGADPHLAEHVSDEIAMVLRLTSWAAGALVDRAEGLARLPKTRAALAAGDIDVPRALVIVGELTGLDAVHAARVEAAVLGRAAGVDDGGVAAGGAPCGDRRRPGCRPAAQGESGEAGAGGTVGRGRRHRGAGWAGPAAGGVLAADAHLTGWAHRLKAAGLPGTLDQLRAQVYLALLNGRRPRPCCPPAPAMRVTPPWPRPKAGLPAAAATRSPPAPTARAARRRPQPHRAHRRPWSRRPRRRCGRG